MNGLNLHRLTIFRTVFETLSVSATARQMKLSQPTISRHLAIFEDELGLRLFNNVSGRLEPTWEAQRLFAESGGLFERLAQVEHSIDSIRHGTQEALRIMASTALCMSVVPQAVGMVRRQMPDLDILVDGGPQKAQLAALREGAIDIAVGGAQQNRPDLRQTLIGQLPLVAVVPLEHPLAREAEFDLAWMAETECVLHNPNAPMGRLIMAHLNAQGIQPKRYLQAFSILFAVGLAKGANLCTVTDVLTAMATTAGSMKIMPLRTPIDLELMAIESASQPTRRSVDTFKKSLSRAFLKSQAAFQTR